MKILVINYEYPPVGGGGGRVAAQVAAGLARRGHAVRVLTSWARGLPAREVSPEGVDVRRLFAFRRRPDTCSVPEMGAYVATQALPAIVESARWRPDVIHVHFAVPSGPVAWMASVLTRTPYVLTAHLGDVPGGAPEQTDRLFRVLKPFTRPIWRGAAAVTAVSSFVAGLAAGAYGVAPRIILNGVNDRSDSPSPPAPDGVPRLVYAGRMSVQKNPLFLGEVLCGLAGIPWRMVFLGDGPLRVPLERRLAAAGLAERCAFRGWADAAEVRRVLGGSDLLLMPSLSEGLPMSAIEALAQGVAIAGSDIPGLADVLDGGVNGLTLPLETEAWKAQLGALLRDPARLEAMKRGSLARAERFDLGTSVKAYEAVLEEAARRR